MTVDSLGGLRRYLGRAMPADADSATRALPDSLLGSLRSRGSSCAAGSTRSTCSGTLEGRDLLARAQRARGVRGTVDVQQVKGRTDRLRSRSRPTRRVAGGHPRRGCVDRRRGCSTRDARLFGASAKAGNGTALRATRRIRDGRRQHGRASRHASTLAIGASRWGLLHPMFVRSTRAGLTIDTLLLGSGSGAHRRLRRTCRRARRCAATCRSPTRCRSPTSACSRSSPRRSRGGSPSTSTSRARAPRRCSRSTGAADSLQVGGLTAEAMRARPAATRTNRAAVDATLVRGGRSILDASVELPDRAHAVHGQADERLAARPDPRRQRGPRARRGALAQAAQRDRPARARSRGERRAEAPARRRARDDPQRRASRCRASASASPDIDMRLAVDPLRDSLAIERLRWTSPASGGNASIGGSVVFRDVHNPRLDLRLDARGAARDRQGRAGAARRLHRARPD